VLIFGTALAFAQYTGGLYRNEGTVITVSLVSGGSAGRQGRETVRRISLKAHPLLLPVQENENILPPLAAPNEAEMPAVGSEVAGSAGADAGGQGENMGNTASNGSENGMVAFSSDQWRQLSSAIEQAKTYPRLARERGIEGTVLVRFKVLPSGAVDSVAVVTSSGSDVLDSATVKTIFRAAPMPYVSGWVEVPISYVLK